VSCDIALELLNLVARVAIVVLLLAQRREEIVQFECKEDTFDSIVKSKCLCFVENL
jgi:hypothetical protein